MKLYGGNCLETPVYWYRIEPEMDCYDFSMVKDVIEEAREAGLHLILLWFGTSKNGHPNYVPEYIKLQPDIYRLAQGPDGAPVPSLSVHCRETLERDKKAFGRFMEFLKEADGESRTVLAVQIENEWAMRIRIWTIPRRRAGTMRSLCRGRLPVWSFLTAEGN